MWNSTRRFFCLPSGVRFVSMGRDSPKPAVSMRLPEMPFSSMYSLTAWARAEEARQRAEQWLTSHPKGAERREMMEAALRRSIMRLRVVQKRSATHTPGAHFRDPNNNNQ